MHYNVKIIDSDVKVSLVLDLSSGSILLLNLRDQQLPAQRVVASLDFQRSSLAAHSRYKILQPMGSPR